MEEYRKCFEDYEISNFGNCRINNKEIKGSINNRGYRYFQVQREGKRNNFLFHHMVAYKFLGDRPDNLVIDHIDRNKLNNHVSNLRYISFNDNLKNCDRYRNDILETNKKKRDNEMRRGYYRDKLLKEGKTLTNRPFGTGSIKKRYGRFQAVITINKVRYNKTFDTEEEAEQYINNIKNNVVV
jgi:hypothetical protein